MRGYPIINSSGRNNADRNERGSIMKTITIKAPFFSLFLNQADASFYAGLFMAAFDQEAEISYENGNVLSDDSEASIDAALNARAANNLIDGLRMAIQGYENHLVFKANGDTNNIDRYNSLFE